MLAMHIPKGMDRRNDRFLHRTSPGVNERSANGAWPTAACIARNPVHQKVTTAAFVTASTAKCEELIHLGCDSPKASNHSGAARGHKQEAPASAELQRAVILNLGDARNDFNALLSP